MPNVAKFAKALYALHQADCLKDPKCRPAVGMFVRQATESAHWHLTTNYRSKQAAELIAAQPFRSPEHYHDWCCKNLRHEHMVPIAVVIDMLVNEPKVTEEFIARTLRTNGLRATIHRDEDRRLNEHGFARKMPQSYWTPGSLYFQDPLARYKEAGLFESLVPLTGARWHPGVNEGCVE
ncbi:hypothetical protein [Roseateles flavus]|uniref:Uncharacterized protein n=1 Tax=Roseateles flavus TaxID=3149041 RepID=A0ABV0GKR2_9BURK